MQIVWKGVISFGLVSIPVRLVAATEEHAVTFHQIHGRDGGRIRYRRVCTVDGEEVPYSDVAKGYELPDGQVVVLTDADFAQLPLPSVRTIEVLGFTAAGAIDPVRLSRAYYCDPTGSNPKAYVLLREALQRTGKVALVKIALRQRESLAMLRPHGGVLVLHVLLWPDEVREPRLGFLDDDVQLRPGELSAAESYIHTLTDAIDPQDTVDRYQAALRQLVEAKVAGLLIEPPPTPAAQTASADLMEALRRSVEEAKHHRDDAPPPLPSGTKSAGKKTRAEKATAKKSTAKKAAAKKATGKKTAAKKTAASKAAVKKTAAKAGRTPARSV